jgi:hypothetical protein
MFFILPAPGLSRFIPVWHVYAPDGSYVATAPDCRTAHAWAIYYTSFYKGM